MYKPFSKYLPFPLILVLIAVVFAACDSTHPSDEGPGEEELITRVVVTLTGDGQTVTATANDPDGDGVNLQIDAITLAAGTTYTGTIDLLNDLASDPAEQDVSAEVEEEAEQHQFFFTVGGGIAGRVTVTITDQDDNGLPVGLHFTVNVSGGGAASGTLRVILSHFDAQPKDGTTMSDETDVDVTFPVNIQ